MSRLTRLKSGGFELDQTLSLSDIRDSITAGTLKNYLYPLAYALRRYPQVTLTSEQWEAVAHGGWLKKSEVDSSESPVVLLYDGRVKALYEIRDGRYKPMKMFETE